MTSAAMGVTKAQLAVMATSPPSAPLKAMLTSHSVSYTHLRAHETVLDLVCRLLLEKKNKKKRYNEMSSSVLQEQVCLQNITSIITR